MKLIHLGVLLVVVVFATGCPKTQTPMPGPLKDQLIRNRVGKLVDLANRYDNLVVNGSDESLSQAMLYRNEIIYQVLLLVDDNYNKFENDLFMQRATGNIAGDMLELGLSAATGITNGERVKTILGIAITAVKGGRKSIDSNYFRERTTEVIAMKMRASRAKVLQIIHQGISLPVREYPLGAGLDDLINYLYAGSLNAALLELAQDTGADAKIAREDAANLKISPFLSPELRRRLRTVSEAREQIFLRLSTGSTTTKKAIEDRLRQSLVKFGFANDEVASADGRILMQMLQRQITQATRNRDEELLTRIQTELNAILDEVGPKP